MLIFVEINIVMSVEQSIASYLTSHRRITVPGLGTFIVKSEGESHELLFSEFLKDDDGVLRGELKSSGICEIEAAGAIDRLLFEVRHATEAQGGEYILKGLGRLYRDSSGVMLFEADGNLAMEVVEEQPEATVTNSVSQLFEQLNEQQSEREEQQTLFSEEDRKETKKVTQSGRKIYNMLWITVPLIALAALVGFVGYVVIDQWRLGMMELPAAVESLLRYVGINRVL